MAIPSSASDPDYGEPLWRIVALWRMAVRDYRGVAGRFFENTWPVAVSPALPLTDSRE
jgi:hypothetical protein